MSKAQTFAFCVSIIQPSIWTVPTNSSSVYVGACAVTVASTVIVGAFAHL